MIPTVRHAPLLDEHLPVPRLPTGCPDELDAKMRLAPSVALIRRGWIAHPARLVMLTTDVCTHSSLPSALVLCGPGHAVVAHEALWRVGRPGAPTTPTEALKRPEFALGAVLARITSTVFPSIELLCVGEVDQVGCVLASTVRCATNDVLRTLDLDFRGGVLPSALPGHMALLARACLDVLRDTE